MARGWHFFRSLPQKGFAHTPKIGLLGKGTSPIRRLSRLVLVRATLPNSEDVMEQVSKRWFGGLLLAVGFVLIPVAGVRAAPVTEEEAHAIGVDAYLYFYPLVTMEITRRQLTNQEPGPGSLGGPMNRFANIPAFPSADMKAVVRPN